jgi:hypothetical protein
MSVLPVASGRFQLVGDALVAAAEDQDLHELVEHDPVGDAEAVAAQRVGVDPLGEQGVELVP